MLQPGHKTGDRRMVGRLLSPLAQEEVGTIRCVGLNVRVIRVFFYFLVAMDDVSVMALISTLKCRRCSIKITQRRPVWLCRNGQRSFCKAIFLLAATFVSRPSHSPRLLKPWPIPNFINSLSIFLQTNQSPFQSNSKPSTALASPSPPSIPLPRPTLATNTGDYESELAVILGPRPCKNVSADNALDYVLGYTAANDVSCREEQLAGSQWCVSKGFDGACPVGELE